jgi:hypothetical protein
LSVLFQFLGEIYCVTVNFHKASHSEPLIDTPINKVIELFKVVSLLLFGLVVRQLTSDVLENLFKQRQRCQRF